MGNDNFKRGNFRDASQKYRKAIFLIENTRILTEEEEKKIKEVSIKLYLNMSEICLKLGKPKKTIFYCKSVFELDPENIKATYRYGKALRILQDFDRARNYLTKAYKMQPNNKEILAEIEKLDE